MDLRDLRAFIAIAEERSFTKAAERLNLSQPPLTRQMHEFEDELGVTLFLRTPQGTQLTHEGAQLLDKARLITADCADFVNLARTLQNRDSSTVRIGIAWRLWELVNVVRAQHLSRFPNVSLEGKDIYSSYQNEALRTKIIDVGFMRPPVDSTRLNACKVLDEYFVVLIDQNSPLATRQQLTIADIADLPLLMYGRAGSTGLHDKVLALYAHAGVKPRIVETTVGPAQEAGLLPIASGKAVYLAPASRYTSVSFGSGVATVRLDEPDATYPVEIAWRKDERAKPVLQFVETVKQVVRTCSNVLATLVLATGALS